MENDFFHNARRILVISDTHGNTRLLDKALCDQACARHVFFLGDNVRDIEKAAEFHTDRIYHIVRGNCDFDTLYPTRDIANVYGKTILFAHGHTLNVKYGLDAAVAYGKNAGTDIVLYGHTHIAYTSYTDGMYIINPGSAGRSRSGANSYAVIDITDKGIMPVIIKF